MRYGGGQCKMEFSWAYTTPTVHDICAFDVLISVSQPFFALHMFIKSTLCCIRFSSLIRAVCKYSMLLLIKDIIFDIVIFIRFFFRDCHTV